MCHFYFLRHFFNTVTKTTTKCMGKSRHPYFVSTSTVNCSDICLMNRIPHNKSQHKWNVEGKISEFTCIKETAANTNQHKQNFSPVALNIDCHARMSYLYLVPFRNWWCLIILCPWDDMHKTMIIKINISLHTITVDAKIRVHIYRLVLQLYETSYSLTSILWYCYVYN